MPPLRYRSPLRYPGGKQKALKQIAPLLPRKIGEYREPMVGGGSVFFLARSLELAQRYWINDAFVDLFHFWQVTQDLDTCTQLQRDLEELRTSFASPDETKAWFLQVREEESTDPYRRALLFFFFNRVTFSGTTRAGGFSKQAALRRFTASSIERLGLLPRALADVRITNEDFATVIEEPGDEVLLFLDPPYYTAHRLYGKSGGLHAFDHQRLAETLMKTSHRFLMTYDDCPEVRDLYAWAHLRPWQLQYGMNNCNRDNTSKIGAELFVSNYELPSAEGTAAEPARAEQLSLSL